MENIEHLTFKGNLPLRGMVFPSKYNREIKYVKMEVEILLMEIIESRKYCVEMGRSNFYGNDLLGILLDEIKKEGGTLNLQLQAIHIGKTKLELKSKRSSRGETPSVDQHSKLTLVLDQLASQSIDLLTSFSFFVICPVLSFQI
ncbi:hypothetical protein JHK87_052430 [Glycine soja]|nr:hypothetical protein JHK87_052430 [Glycine soja]